MKKNDIAVGEVYAVAVDHLRQGTTAGSEGLVKATVLGFTEPLRWQQVEVQVRLAEPYTVRWASAKQGKTDFTIPTRKVIATWAEHEPAVKAREERKAAAEREQQERDAAIAANREELRSLIPVELQPKWLLTDWLRDGGHLTTAELLAILKSTTSTTN